MANVRVYVNGPEVENTTAVVLGAGRWGLNGYPWGTPIDIAPGLHDIRVFKTTDPTEISVKADVTGPVRLDITVNQDSINVVS